VIASYLRVIRSPRYAPIWLGQLISNLGDTLNYIALVVLVYQLTGSGLALSTLVLVQVVPVLVGGPIAGPVIDRFPRQSVLITADLVRSLFALGLVVAATSWQVYGLAFGLALATVFFSPALAASLPALVPDADLVAANAVGWSTAQLVQIIGAALSGGLIALFGVRIAFGINAVSFLVSAASIAVVAFPVIERPAPRSYRHALREGIAYARQDQFVSRLFAVQFLASLAVGATSALLVVLAERHYQLPPAGFATFLLAIALGALLGPLLLGSMLQQAHDGRFLFLPYIVRGVGDVLLGLVTVPVLGQLLLFVYGLSTSTGMVSYQTAMQTQVPDAVRGRIFSLMDIGWNVARLASVVFGGILADRFGIVAVYYAGGVLLIAAGVLGFLTVRLPNQATLPSAREVML
jgi:MFS family permease